MTPDDLLYGEGLTRGRRTPCSTLSIGDLAHPVSPVFPQQVLVSTATAACATLLATATGYAFSRFQFRGKHLVAGLILRDLDVSAGHDSRTDLSPVKPLGLTNSLTGLVIVYTAFNVPLASFLMQSFFDAIPADLEEAAMLDGAARFTAFRRIMVPLALPARRP